MLGGGGGQIGVRGMWWIDWCYGCVVDRLVLGGVVDRLV